MSTATMTDDQAYDLLMEQVYVPAFFNKLAAHGIFVGVDVDAVRCGPRPSSGTRLNTRR